MALVPPNAELVGQAWAARYASIDAGSVATTLPRTPEGQVSTWSEFLTMRALAAGSPDPTLSERRASVLQLDAWGREPRRARPAWGYAATIIERIRAATFRDAAVRWSGKTLPMPISGYMDARVLGVYLTREPTRVEGDPSGYARFTCDIALDWTV